MNAATDEIYQRLRKQLDDALNADKRLANIAEKIKRKQATLADTAEYSEIVANHIAAVLQAAVGDIRSPLGKELVCRELLRDHYAAINDVLGTVQAIVDEQREIHIRPQQAAFPAERVQKVAHALEDPTVSLETIRRRANAPVANVAKSFHDDYIKENAKFRADAGLKCWIVRTTDGKCCKWCTQVAGRYEYGTEPEDVYRRHDNCGCTTIYENGRQRQDVWSKKKWEVPAADAGAPKPTILTPAQGRALLAKHKPTVLTRGRKSGTIQEKIRLYNIHNKTNVGVFTAEEIEAAMQSSPIGRNASKYFTEAGMSLEMNYDHNVQSWMMGYVSDGKTITVNVANHSDALEVSQTIVHEIAHRQFGWINTQEDEVNCMIYDYLHRHQTISDQKIAEIVECVRELYDDLPEGNLYGY